jgi:hypothetical protein
MRSVLDTTQALMCQQSFPGFVPFRTQPEAAHRGCPLAYPHFTQGVQFYFCGETEWTQNGCRPVDCYIQTDALPKFAGATTGWGTAIGGGRVPMGSGRDWPSPQPIRHFQLHHPGARRRVSTSRRGLGRNERPPTPKRFQCLQMQSENQPILSPTFRSQKLAKRMRLPNA